MPANQIVVRTDIWSVEGEMRASVTTSTSSSDNVNFVTSWFSEEQPARAVEQVNSMTMMSAMSTHADMVTRLVEDIHTSEYWCELLVPSVPPVELMNYPLTFASDFEKFVAGLYKLPQSQVYCQDWIAYDVARLVRAHYTDYVVEFVVTTDGLCTVRDILCYSSC